MKRVLLALMVGVLALGATAAPAAADRGSITDESGDAPARIDITRLSVDSGTRWFTMRADVRNLRQKGEFDFSYWRGLTGGLPMQSLIVVVHRVEGETKARFFTCGIEDCAPAPCPRLRATWRPGKDFVRISAPHRCYPKPRTRPHARPPAAGRYDVWSQLGDSTDSLEGRVAVRRG